MAVVKVCTSFIGIVNYCWFVTTIKDALLISSCWLGGLFRLEYFQPLLFEALCAFSFAVTSILKVSLYRWEIIFSLVFTPYLACNYFDAKLLIHDDFSSESLELSDDVGAQGILRHRRCLLTCKTSSKLEGGSLVKGPWMFKSMRRVCRTYRKLKN